MQHYILVYIHMIELIGLLPNKNHFLATKEAEKKNKNRTFTKNLKLRCDDNFGKKETSFESKFIVGHFPLFFNQIRQSGIVGK